MLYRKKATNTYLGCITKKIYSNFNLPTFLLKHLSPFSLNPEIASEEKKREKGGEILSPLCTFSQSAAQLFFPAMKIEEALCQVRLKPSLSISNNAARKLLR